MWPNFPTRHWQRKKDKQFNLVWLIDKVMGEDYCATQWVEWKLKVMK
jgi:hypothetical protein